ncbi:hypothetical protein LCGC14_0859630 [marine sediment metagenome]|uniref:Uncharacterized protein n=1 Tax=marine sediment metagenome TaxID=412755 RepID=A0A0F9SEU3_9ZZZZ
MARIFSPVEFASVLIAYCAATRGSVSSWGRTAKHNADVGGASNSFHLVWLGADVVYDEPVPLGRAKSFARRLGLRLVREDDHDHLQVEVSQ